MSSSNCCFLTCIQVSQEADQVVWYSHLFKNFPQFVVLHTVKGFNVVNKAEVDVFLEFSCFLYDPMDVDNWMKRCPFHHKWLECKNRKSRDTWNKRKVWPWSTEWRWVKTNRVLPIKFSGYSKYPLLTTQKTSPHMDITKCSIPNSDWLYSLQPNTENLYSQQK